MVKEILVLRDTGIPLFHYSFDGNRKVDEIVAAFLSAIGSFAKEASDQQLRVISFASNKFIWVQRGDIYFIALVAYKDSTEIYYIILQEIARLFIGQYYDNLRNLDDDGTGALLHKFEDFADGIERILRKFDGIPGLTRRYNRALISPQDTKVLKRILTRVEGDVLLRGGAITNDGYIIVSTLRVYEIDAILQMLTTILGHDRESERPILIAHPSLDPRTTFIVSRLSDCICAFVGRSDVEDNKYYPVMRPFIQAIKKISCTSLKKLDLEVSGHYATFHDLDMVVSILDPSEVIENARVHFTDLDSNIRGNIVKILRELSHEIMVGTLIDSTGLDRAHMTEALAILVARGIVQVNRVYPQLGFRDERFTSYLEIIGMPKRDYMVLNQIWNHCDGKTSVMEIARKTGFSTSRVMEVLKKLGNHVKWNTERSLVEYE